MTIQMNNARIDRLLMQLNEQMDKELLDHIGFEVQKRLTNKRAEGRGGWFRMESWELAELMCKVMETRGENMFLDIIAIAAFMQGRQCDPKEVMQQLEAYLGRNWNCRESAKSVGAKEDGAQSIAQCDNDLDYTDLVKKLGLENQKDYIIRTVSDKAFRNHEYRWCSATQLFTNVCSKDDKVHISVLANAQLAPQVEAMPLEELEPEEVHPINGRLYNLRINGAPCFNQYKYFEASGQFRECNDKGRMVKGGCSYPLGGEGVEWGEV